MLVAKRDAFDHGAHEPAVLHSGATAANSRLARTMTVLQMVGAVLAIPVGLGSAYSMYQANFSVEATCKNLRVNIVRMLDKSVDASTRHMLVRRDVEAFEKSCGNVDPDATAAFKALLAADKVAPVTSVAISPAQPQWQTVVHKTDAALPIAQPVVRPVAPVAAAPVQREAPMSDAAWVTAVRSALANRDSDRAPATQAPAAAPRPLAELPAAQVVPATPAAAPALPPPATVTVISPPQTGSDHPVPPGAIPEAAPADVSKQRSRLGALVEDIPFFGQALADRVSR